MEQNLMQLVVLAKQRREAFLALVILAQAIDLYLCRAWGLVYTMISLAQFVVCSLFFADVMGVALYPLSAIRLAHSLYIASGYEIGSRSTIIIQPDYWALLFIVLSASMIGYSLGMQIANRSHKEKKSPLAWLCDNPQLIKTGLDVISSVFQVVSPPRPSTTTSYFRRASHNNTTDSSRSTTPTPTSSPQQQQSTVAPDIRSVATKPPRKQDEAVKQDNLGIGEAIRHATESPELLIRNQPPLTTINKGEAIKSETTAAKPAVPDSTTSAVQGDLNDLILNKETMHHLAKLMEAYEEGTIPSSSIAAMIQGFLNNNQSS